jgi:hypothetical protein
VGETVVAEKIRWHQMKPATKVRANFFVTNRQEHTYDQAAHEEY